MSEAAVVTFLRRPDAYAEAPTSVDVIETHMSWVFLAGEYAYKLKKPIRSVSVDLSTPDQRCRNCQEEVRLNRRLAPDVYLGVVPVVRRSDGALTLDGQGEPIDWLVRMRRLSADEMLDAVIERGRAPAEEVRIRGAATFLAHFYLGATTVPISAHAYRTMLEDGTGQDVQELLHPRHGLTRDRVDALARAQLALLHTSPALFDRRVHAGRIVEGHGDLRPEHISVGRRPAIIDCLEFARHLRVVDPLDELAFLSLECDRLGDGRAGLWFLEAYREVTSDETPAELLHFYRVYRALRRATIAIWHLDDPGVRDPERFAARARQYLALVEPVPVQGSRSSASG